MAILKSLSVRRPAAACLCGIGLTLGSPAVASADPSYAPHGTLIWCTDSFCFTNINGNYGNVWGTGFTSGYWSFGSY
ncbi:MAG: hypothetical protein LLG14_26705 [Nocardiaceae bacterium]|nr:hypothetical protein [Nocardiaceae bacterium]